MSFHLNRINPNQTQVHFLDGRLETLTNEELEEFLSVQQVEFNEQSTEM